MGIRFEINALICSLLGAATIAIRPVSPAAAAQCSLSANTQVQIGIDLIVVASGPVFQSCPCDLGGGPGPSH